MNKEEKEILKKMAKRYKIALWLAIRNLKTFNEVPEGTSIKELDKKAYEDMGEMLLYIDWKKLEKAYDKVVAENDIIAKWKGKKNE